MEKLVVIDTRPEFIEIHTYDVESNIHISDNFVKQLGFNPNFTFSFFINNINIIQDNEIIKNFKI